MTTKSDYVRVGFNMSKTQRAELEAASKKMFGGTVDLSATLRVFIENGIMRTLKADERRELENE